MRWCGTARWSASLGFAVPIERPRKSCRESATRISTGRRAAMANASSDLPDAVGPMMAAIGAAADRFSAGRSPPRAGRPRAGAIGLVDLHEALDLLDRGGSP